MSRWRTLAVFVIPGVVIWWHMPWYVWFLTGVGAVVAFLILLVQAGNERDRERA